MRKRSVKPGHPEQLPGTHQTAALASSTLLLNVFLWGWAGCSQPTPVPLETDNRSEQAQQNPQNEIRQKAAAGVGRKGQKLRDHHGPLATPAKALFHAEQQLIFMQVQRALQMHEIQFGYPATHEEFMDKIIRANNISLPELPAGQRYEYDPQTHELMVVGSATDDR
jgi:hypothetical protein